MPPFMLSALALIARGTTLIRGQALGLGVGSAVGGLLAGGPGIPGVDLFPDEKKRRRRRRRALTASDRADIAFIAGLLGTTAGKNFALTIATRTG